MARRVCTFLCIPVMPLKLVLVSRPEEQAKPKEQAKPETMASQEASQKAKPEAKVEAMDPVAKCIFDALVKEALELGIPMAFTPVYVVERVQTFLLFEASFAEADALSAHFRPMSFKALRDCPAKICVLYCARMPYVFNWSLVKDKQHDKDFVETFLTNFKEPVVSLGPKRSLSPSLFRKICL